MYTECQNLVFLNTQFKQHPRRLYTWKSLQDKPEKIVRNQIYFILINKRFRICCISMRTYPRRDTNLDHTPLIGEFRIRLNKISRYYNLKQLKDQNVKEEVKICLTLAIVIGFLQRINHKFKFLIVYIMFDRYSCHRCVCTVLYGHIQNNMHHTMLNILMCHIR